MHVGAHTECGAANERNREREGAHECEFGLNVLPSLLYLISLMNPKSSTNWLLIVIESCNANRKPNDVIFPVVCCFVMYVIIVTFFCVSCTNWANVLDWLLVECCFEANGMRHKHNPRPFSVGGKQWNSIIDWNKSIMCNIETQNTQISS